MTEKKRILTIYVSDDEILDYLRETYVATRSLSDWVCSKAAEEMSSTIDTVERKKEQAQKEAELYTKKAEEMHKEKERIIEEMKYTAKELWNNKVMGDQRSRALSYRFGHKMKTYNIKLSDVVK